MFPFVELARGLLQALRGSALPPRFHNGRVFFDAEAFAVEVAELVLGAGVALFGGEFVPVGGAGVVLFDALTVLVHDAEVVLGVAVALSGGLFEAVRGVAGGAVLLLLVPVLNRILKGAD